MAISVVGGVPRIVDDNTSLQIVYVWSKPGEAWALIGPSSVLFAGTNASMGVQRASNPTFAVVRLEEYFRRLLATTDLTPERLDQFGGTRQ